MRILYIASFIVSFWFGLSFLVYAGATGYAAAYLDGNTRIFRMAFGLALGVFGWLLLFFSVKSWGLSITHRRRVVEPLKEMAGGEERVE